MKRVWSIVQTRREEWIYCPQRAAQQTQFAVNRRTPAAARGRWRTRVKVEWQNGGNNSGRWRMLRQKCVTNVYANPDIVAVHRVRVIRDEQESRNASPSAVAQTRGSKMVAAAVQTKMRRQCCKRAPRQPVDSRKGVDANDGTRATHAVMRAMRKRVREGQVRAVCNALNRGNVRCARRQRGNARSAG